MTVWSDSLAVGSGGLVGLSLGLIGGGGSILATPLLLYVVGLSPPHLAIGTGALAVAANAFMSFTNYARSGTVRWRNALVFAVVGSIGALVGASVGKVISGDRLLFLFGLLMLLVGGLMLKAKRSTPVTNSDQSSRPWVPEFTALAVGDLVAGSRRIRTNDRSQLCALGPRRLEGCGRVYIRRLRRRVDRDATCQSSVAIQERPGHRICIADFRCCGLCSLQKRPASVFAAQLIGPNRVRHLFNRATQLGVWPDYLKIAVRDLLQPVALTAEYEETARRIRKFARERVKGFDEVGGVA